MDPAAKAVEAGPLSPVGFCWPQLALLARCCRHGWWVARGRRPCVWLWRVGFGGASDEQRPDAIVEFPLRV
eukprot:855162-Lingulodinium_polyedra.AAC.1